MSDRKNLISDFEYAVRKADAEGWDFVDLTTEDGFEILDMLKAQEPRVLTLEEFENHWKIPPQQRPPIWEEWKIDNGKGHWKLYGRATGCYGTQWRCWSARPTDEQREATPWE